MPSEFAQAICVSYKWIQDQTCARVNFADRRPCDRGSKIARVDPNPTYERMNFADPLKILASPSRWPLS
ncbi:hypothetical protein L596_013904 [Steinernema carpocapsae]|uniref:Uncharacterized protein n=1 Tax=Steinernema carpocapsae TaxID=34508 RepID=A0A4U5P2X8_STECR|nr:hypothetical protein L596_013904 [Steinernema carpocapsae]